MTYNLFLDDERMPPESRAGQGTDEDIWVIVRSYDEAIKVLLEKGCPNFISFDHDLGYQQQTGMDVAKRLVEMIMNKEIKWNKDFHFYVHSQNPVGARNIEMYLAQFLRKKWKEDDA